MCLVSINSCIVFHNQAKETFFFAVWRPVAHPGVLDGTSCVMEDVGIRSRWTETGWTENGKTLNFGCFFE